MASRSRSRSPVQFNQENESQANVKIAKTENQPDKHYNWQLSITNCPLKWNYVDAKSFIFNSMKSVPNVSSDIFVFFKVNKRTVSIKCTTYELAKLMYQKFNNLEVDGVKLCATMRQFSEKKMKWTSPVNWKERYVKFKYGPNVSHVYNKFNDNETYGLSDQLLQHLGITPPLISKLFIRNLSPEVDESKLMEVFSLAGKIIDLKLMTHNDGTSKCMATITYDHPVEAVQAISMFNKRSLCGNQMEIELNRMNKKRNMAIPRELDSIGLGLGEQGCPLQFVRARVQIEQLKHDIKEWLTSQTDTEQNTNSSINKQQNNLNDALNMFTQSANSLGNNLNPNPAVNTNVQTLLQGLMQQANPVSAVSQNPLQSFLALMSNMGNQSTNQTLPALNNQSLNVSQTQVTPNVDKQQGQPAVNLQMHSNLVNQQMPPNSVNQQIPSNLINQHIPSNLISQNIPPNLVNQQLPPNSVNQGIPPNLVNQQIAPNFGNQQIAPNFGNQQIAPNFGNLLFDQPSHRSMNQHNAGSSNVGSIQDSSMGDMVVFTNLPTSVYIEALKGKMQEVGEVMFAEMTGNGKAIVRFGSERQAEECIRLFDGCKVDGQVISVRFA